MDRLDHLENPEKKYFMLFICYNLVTGRLVAPQTPFFIEIFCDLERLAILKPRKNESNTPKE